ncbi:MAG: hypothetical protein CFE21_06970 [Bacteroidetes bacterium B1(2017)]|nr:MAG: hypothetical protein CFE21_06970 [Bacteroidetes bacterium B1(2017)]
MKTATKYKRIFLPLFLNCLLLLAFQKESRASLPIKSAIQFTENKGQWQENVLFKADIPIGNIFIEKNCLTYLFIDKEATHEYQHGKDIKSVHFHSVKVYFQNSNPNPGIEKTNKSDEYYNYFVSDQSKWASFVYAYKRIVLKNIYPKTDLEIISKPDGIKINFVLQAGADPSKIQLKYEGADELFIKENQLHVKTSLGEMIESAPVSYQQIGQTQKAISTQYTLQNNTLGFKLKTKNTYLPITIDPDVIFGTYMGSAADNFGFAASYDTSGNAYGAGTVYAANFPFTTGAYDVSFNGGSAANNEYARDAFIAKFNPSGSALIFGTFLGGSDNEQPHSVTIVNGEIFVFGTTYSSNFPTTFAALDRSYNGGADIFVLKLNSSGSSLIASTFIGGTNDDGINGESHYGFPAQSHDLPYNYADWFRGEVLADLTGNIYITTCTKSTQAQGLPIVNANQFSFGGGNQDAYFIKLTNSLSSLIFATYLGGTGDESAYSVCVNSLNEPIITGGTTSSSLAFNTSTFGYSGDVDGFIAKYSSSGVKQRLIYSGTATYDQSFFVQTDDINNIYILGQTNGNMPKSSGVYGTANAKQFLQKYNSSLSTLLLSTTFGKAGAEPSISPSAFLIDVCGRIYVSGWGGGTNESYHFGMDDVTGLATTPDAFQKNTDGSDFYLMVLAPNFGSLLYASYYGGTFSQEHVDGGTSHFDRSGVVYQAVCAGCGGLSDFPTTPTAYSKVNPGKRAYNTNIGGCNLGMFKFDMRTYMIPPKFTDTTLTIIAGQTLDYDFFTTDAGGDNLTISFTGDILTRPINPAVITTINNVPGLIASKLHFSTLCSDYPSDTIVIDVTVTDGACPAPNEIYGKIKIVLRSEPIPAPFPECIKIVNDNTLQLTWINGAANSDFKNYQLLRKINNGPLTRFDSISNQIKTSYKDSVAPDNLNQNYCYQMVSLNSCGRPGDSSRVICSLPKSDTLGSNYFTGLQTELFVLHAFDTFTRDFRVASVDTKDSVFVKLGGSFNTLGKGTRLFVNGLGEGIVSLDWIPTCGDIYQDTLELQIIVRDNTCPYFRQATKIIQFLVIPALPVSPPVSYCPKIISSDSILLEWSTFVPSNLTKELFLIRTVNGVPTRVASFTDLSTGGYTDIFKFVTANTTCYKLSSMDVCGFYGDTSISSCVQNDKTFAPNLAIYTATVSNNKDVQLVFEEAESDSFWRYQIWKRAGRAGAYSLHKEIRTLEDTVYTDSEVKVGENSYCYQLVNIDLCGNKSIKNKEACTILLDGKAEPFVNNMNWLPYDYWDQGVNKYEILKTEPTLYEDAIFGSKSIKPLMATDTKLNYDNGLYEYTILAYENDFGNNQTSKSNTIQLLQLPVLYSPNAYTDNNDGVNDVFHLVPVFVRDYHLQIYNRWGERIFETYSKKDGFKGTYGGNESQGDVYFYIVEYGGWDNSKYIKKGNFTLLR